MKPVCSAPWSSLYIDNDGWVYLCCRTERPESDHSPSEWALKLFFHQFTFMEPDIYTVRDSTNAEIRNAHQLTMEFGDEYDQETLKKLSLVAGRHKGLSRPLGNIREVSLQDIWESKYLDEIRATMLKGEFPEKQCWRCQWEIKNNVKEGVLLDIFNDAYPYESVRETYRNGPKTLNIHMGNLCNLKCVMCNAKYSSRHAEGRVMDYLTGNEKFDSSLRAFIPQLRDINFGGGEPLINKNLIRYLDMIVQAKSSVEVAYVTNLTTLRPEFLKLIPRLFLNRFGVSIDGVGENYENVRQGARWENVLANLMELGKNKRKYRIESIFIKMCVMPQNYTDIESLLDITRELEGKLSFNLVYYPERYSPFKVPEETRSRIRSHLGELYARRKQDIDAFCTDFQSLSVI